MFELIIQGIQTCLSPVNLLAMFLSVPLGIIVGCLPGFGAATGLVLVLPMTYSMEPSTAFVALTGIYLGAEYGGSISAILLNTPGTAAAVVTSFDGHQMARQGKARDALLISNIASFSGGMIGGLCMLLFMPLLGPFVLEFGAGEIFVLSAAGLLLVGSVTRGNRIKGVISVGLGLLFTFVGADGVTGVSRFDFDIPILVGGLPLIAGLLAMFAIPQMLDVAMGPRQDTTEIHMGNGGLRGNMGMFGRYLRKIYRCYPLNILRSSLFGVIIGIIPGVGAAVSSMAAYSAAKKASKHPEEFGHGAEDGIVAPESANNALVGGSLIPVLSLGIPGSAAAALYMGAIFMHGMTPGPNFLIKQADLVYILIMAVFLCSVVQLVLGALTIGSFANILKVPASRLFPAVIAVCCIGAYVVRTLDFDISFFIWLGLIAYLLSALGFDMKAVVLGAFLAPAMERALMEAMSIAPAMGGLVPYFMSRTIALVMLGVILLYLAFILVSSWRQARICPPAEEEGTCLPAEWKGERGTDLAVYILLILGSLWLGSICADYPFRSRLFPLATFGLIILCCVIGIVRCVFFSAGYGGRNISPLARIPWRKFAVLGAYMAGYLALMDVLGFYVATVPYVIANSLTIHFWQEGSVTKRRVLWDIVFALAYTLIAYLVFTVIFLSEMPMPEWLEYMEL